MTNITDFAMIKLPHCRITVCSLSGKGIAEPMAWSALWVKGMTVPCCQQPPRAFLSLFNPYNSPSSLRYHLEYPT